MALSLILRNANKFEGLKNVIGSVGVAKNFSQIQTRYALSLTNKCTHLQVIKPTITYRSISSTAPRCSAHGNHTTLWNAERALSLGLLGLIPAALMTPCGLFDNLLAISLVAHQHWGLEACVIDYIRPIIFGNAIPKLALGTLYAVSILTLAGLLYFNYHDIGIGRAVRKFWSVNSK